MNQLSAVTPVVGIVIVSYNTCALLRDCLRSTARPELPANVVVVDNASEDGSTDMVGRDFPHVELIRNAENCGFAVATNQGLRAVLQRCSFILLLNPDAVLQDGALEAMVAFMQAHPRVGVCGGRLLYPDGRPQHGAFRFPTLLMALFDLVPPRGPLLGRLQDSFLNGRYREEQGPEPFPIDHPLGATMLIRREALAEVGCFDEDYWMYAEEVDWCFRCRRAGWAIWQVPAARVAHVGGASSAQFRGRSLVALHRSRLRFVVKWQTAGYRRWYRRVVRLGICWTLLETWSAWARGRASTAELRARLLAYGTILRLLSDAETLVSSSESA